MVAPRPILKSLPLYTPDTMKQTRTTRFDADVDVCVGAAGDSDHDHSFSSDRDYSDDSEPTSPSAFPFSSTAHIPPFSPHVHFPPTPKLTQTGMTHSSISYDRKPIEVQPNELALPARGERELDSESDADTDVEEEDGPTWKTFGDGQCDQGYFQLRKPSYDVQVVDSMDIDDDHELELGSERRACSFATGSPRSTSSSASSSRHGSPRASALKSKPKALRPQTPYSHPAHDCSPLEAEAKPHSTVSAFDYLLPPPPPLVFDPSSESDSDLCISPDNGSCVQSPDDVSHLPHLSSISLHLVGLSPKLHLDVDQDDGEMDPEYALNGIGDYAHHTPSPSSLLTRKRATGDRHHSPRSEDGKRHKRGRSPRIESDPDAGSRTRDSDTIPCSTTMRNCDAAAAGRQSRGHCNSPSSQFSSFYEGGLDGCLGGF